MKQIGSIAHNMKSTLSFYGFESIDTPASANRTGVQKQNGITRINDNFTLISATCQLAITEARELISLMLDFLLIHCLVLYNWSVS